jgi:membrane-bound lytic murein transglycosylase B
MPSRALTCPSSTGASRPIAYDAYRTASEQAGIVATGCGVHWTVLAGLGRVESRHGLLEAGHRIEANGDVTPAIRGPQLDGTGGTLAIADTDGGATDGDALWDRAMGPLQFIPTTWAQLGRDGNADGVADPDNLYDAAITAVAHLCLRQPGDYSDRSELRRALLAYNASGRYADQVLGWIDRYASLPLGEVLAPA